MADKEKIQEQMISVAIGLLNENEICTFCSYKDTENCRKDDFYCQNGIYNGLLTQAKKELQ